jgi:molybdate transport system substrate-binding protein
VDATTNHSEDIMNRRSALLALSLVASAAFALPVQAGEITILLNQATESGVREVATAFEQKTGHKVHVSFQGGPNLNNKINAGEGDMASLGMPQFNDFTKTGKIFANAVFEYARVGNGVAVKEGARKFDISTPAAFKQAMLDAKSIGHTNAGTGPYNTRLFQKLGIYDQIKDKISIIEGRLVAKAVFDGDIEVGIQQTNVIQPFKGTVYLGPLPAELMEYGRMGIGILSTTKEPQIATAFANFITSPEAAPLLRKGAMEPAK